MNKSFGKKLEHIVFLGPATLLFAVVVIIPFLISIYFSLTDWNGISKTMNFIGFNNYINIFSENSRFLQAFGFTFNISFVIVALTNIIGIGLAALLINKFFGSNLFRAIFFLPNTMGGVVMGYIWRFIFLLVIQYLGMTLNWAIFKLPWLGTEETAFVALVIVSVWQGVGYVMVIMIAALAGVPLELSEAAKIDGASSWRTFWKIKIPFTMPYITVCLFWTIATAFKMFDINVALTKGGPYGSTTPMALQIYYDAFNSNRYGFANAESIVFFLIIFLVTSIQLFLSRRKERAYE
ncbi:MAG: ABC transporter permease [Chloroflexi bacterium HGW-Chloroflexi-3]|nr:MAG: ABC transporter permease [Chloroflexi bacterium HGW-Chloroflexi-3]